MIPTCIVILWSIITCRNVKYMQGRQTGGLGVGGVATPLNFGGGGGDVEYLSTPPPDFESFLKKIAYI